MTKYLISFPIFPHRLRSLAFAATALLVAGCDVAPEKLFDMLDTLSGREENVVVLARQPVLLTPEPTVLTTSETMKVVGEWTSLCLSLRGGIPLQDSTTMDQAFAAAMQNARVSVHVVLANGDRVALRPPLQAWSMRGKVLKSDELAACASTPCKADLPVGAQVARIEVSSEPALSVQGIYWHSERGPLEDPAPPPVVAAASAPRVKSSCTARAG